jgi:POT family proton-dependent oligopeptide transporter
MSSMHYLLLGWVLITTGELCLSPVGLSMITKLSPTRMVSTVMGGWFLATAFSNLLAALIATLTAVGEGGDGVQVIPPPKDTVHVYGDVLGLLALVAMGAAVLCLALSPILTRWMRPDESDEEEVVTAVS